MWRVGSICWGVVVEKLMVMSGVGEDEMKGKHDLSTTIQDPSQLVLVSPPKLIVSKKHFPSRFFFWMGCFEIAPEPISKLEMFFDSDFQWRNLEILSSSLSILSFLETGKRLNSKLKSKTLTGFISHQTRVATSTNKTFNLDVLYPNIS